MYLNDILRILHPATVEFIFFSSEHGTYAKIDIMLTSTASINKCQMIAITQNTASDYILELITKQKNNN